MQKIVKKHLPKEITSRLSNHLNEPDMNTYYIIDGDVYIHTKFYIEEEDPSLELIHDVAFVESEMIQHMQALNKIYLNEDKVPYFKLYDLALWFYDRIPSKDWYELLSFLRVITEFNETTNYIKFGDQGTGEPVQH